MDKTQKQGYLSNSLPDLSLEPQAMPSTTTTALIDHKPAQPHSPRLFQHTAEAKINPQTVKLLLRLVAEGEQDPAEALVKKTPALLLAKGSVTDLSKRTFTDITAFQYALWALDWHMWTMLMKYLPVEAQREQFLALEKQSTAHGSHFDVGPLIQALNTYIKKYANWSVDQCEHHWCKVVGGAQHQLPANLVNEYCHPNRSFFPCPSFTKKTLPRTRKTEEGEWLTAQWNGGRLGEKFGVARAACDVAVCLHATPGLCGIPSLLSILVAGGEDVAALLKYKTVRTQQLSLLRKQLTPTASLRPR